MKVKVCTAKTVVTKMTLTVINIHQWKFVQASGRGSTQFFWILMPPPPSKFLAFLHVNNSPPPKKKKKKIVTGEIGSNPPNPHSPPPHKLRLYVKPRVNTSRKTSTGKTANQQGSLSKILWILAFLASHFCSDTDFSAFRKRQNSFRGKGFPPE